MKYIIVKATTFITYNIPNIALQEHNTVKG